MSECRLDPTQIDPQQNYNEDQSGEQHCRNPFHTDLITLFNSIILTTITFFDKIQSGYRKHHSTEIALLKVVITDSNNVAVLFLLDLSAAFDTIYHSILMNHLEKLVGLSGQSLDGLTLTCLK